MILSIKDVTRIVQTKSIKIGDNWVTQRPRGKRTLFQVIRELQLVIPGNADLVICEEQ